MSGSMSATLARAAAAAASLFLFVSVADAQQGTVHIRGEIAAVEGDILTVMSREGDRLALIVPEKARISGLADASLDTVKAGVYIGTAAMPQKDGSLIAQEVLIFPDAMRGAGEGHRPWDLTAGSTMTNATVESAVAAVKGDSLTLKYKDGEKTLLVPPGTPIVTIVPAKRSDLAPGASIFAVASKAGDGRYQAVRISVGMKGLVPPM